MQIIIFLQITQAFPLKFNDPPLKLSSRQSWVEKPENYAQILKGMVALKWQLDVKLSRKVTHVIALHLIGKISTTTAIVIDNKCDQWAR